MKRVFAAIDISGEARRAAVEYTSDLRGEFPDSPVRWERPEKLHITVKFAGSLNEDQLEAFKERVEMAANQVSPFRIRIDGSGAFIKRRGPSALWLGIKQLSDNDPVGTIAAMLESEEKRRPYHPHVTIARLKHANKAKELIERHRAMNFESAEFEVSEMVIYESKLLPSGSVYSRLVGFRFGVD